MKLFHRRSYIGRIAFLVGLFLCISFWGDNLQPRNYYPEKAVDEENGDKKEGDARQPQSPFEKPKYSNPQHHDSMRLEPQKEDNEPESELNSYSMSLKKDSNERQITPGVSYTPGKSVNVKLPSKDETIELEKDHSYSSDYQVVWKKKF